MKNIALCLIIAVFTTLFAANQADAGEIQKFESHRNIGQVLFSPQSVYKIGDDLYTFQRKDSLRIIFEGVLGQKSLLSIRHEGQLLEVGKDPLIIPATLIAAESEEVPENHLLKMVLFKVSFLYFDEDTCEGVFEITILDNLHQSQKG